LLSFSIFFSQTLREYNYRGYKITMMMIIITIIIMNHNTNGFSATFALTVPIISTDEKEERKTVLSYIASLSVGPDGLRPQWFSGGNLAVTFCRPSRPLLTWCWLNTVHRKPHVIFHWSHYSWHLRKKTGGIRPIAIGFTLE